MTLETWLAFAVLETVLCFTPGPAVLFVVSTTLVRGTRAGFGGALGVVACNTFYFVLSALGVAAVILASGQLFTALKWLGAAYLVWLGLQLLLQHRAAARDRPAAAPSLRPAAGAALRGFGVQAANPKALAFFVALVPQFIDPDAPIALQIGVLALTSAVIETGALGTYIVLTARAGAMAGTRSAAWLKRVAGGFLVAAGVRLALLRSA